MVSFAQILVNFWRGTRSPGDTAAPPPGRVPSGPKGAGSRTHRLPAWIGRTTEVPVPHNSAATRIPPPHPPARSTSKRLEVSATFARRLADIACPTSLRYCSRVTADEFHDALHAEVGRPREETRTIQSGR